MNKRRALWTRLLWALLAVASVAWMAAYFFYVEEALGWQNVPTLLPHEVATLVLALVLPPMLLVT
jgi:hypothetical protein